MWRINAPRDLQGIPRPGKGTLVITLVNTLADEQLQGTTALQGLGSLEELFKGIGGAVEQHPPLPIFPFPLLRDRIHSVGVDGGAASFVRADGAKELFEYIVLCAIL